MTSIDHVDALTIPASVKWGGGSTMIAGGFALVVALQIVLVAPLESAAVIGAEFASIALGLICIAAGWRTLRAGGTSAIVATAAVSVLALVSGAWLFFSFARGLMSAVALALPVLSLLAVVLAASAIAPARRVGRAHDALAREGLELRPSGLGRMFARPLRVVAVLGVVTISALGAMWWRRAHRAFDPLATPVGELLGQKLTDYVVARGTEKRAHRDALRSERARSVLGPEVTQALDALLERAESLEQMDESESDRARGPEAGPPPSVDAFLLAAGGLEDALRASNLSVFVDVDFLRGRERVQPLLLSYYVEREASYDAGGKLVRTLHMWRMDRLRVSLPYLGYTRPRTSSALVLLDTIETDLVTGIVPALRPGERFELVGDADTRRGAWVEALEKKAGDRARAELGAEADDPRFSRLAELLARRRSLVRKWAATLPQLGLVLHVPQRYVPEARYEEELSHRVPRRDLDEWKELHEELMKPSMLDAFVALRRRVVGSVERHEIQHRLDYGAGLLAVPPDICALLGIDNPLGVSAASVGGRARDELSAYLAQIASGATPIRDLLLLSRSLFGERSDAYSYAAWAAFLGIGRELDIDTSLIARGRVHAEQFGRVLDALIERTPVEIRAAAARYRRAAYGADLPEVRLLNATDHATWRR